MAHAQRNNLGIYDDVAAQWWSDDIRWVRTLRNMVPGRLSWFNTQIDWAGKDVLDLGCAGGFMAEALDDLGARVTGIDPAKDAITAAIAHAEQGGRAIRYDVGVGEALPYADEANGFFICLATHGGHDLGCGIGGNGLHRFQRACADLSDFLFALGGFHRDLGIGIGRGLRQVCLNLCFRLGDDALGFAACVSQCLVIGGFGIYGFRFQLFGGGDIVRNCPLTLGQNSRDARQRDARQDEIDHDQRDHQPEDLVTPVRKIELRHAGRRCPLGCVGGVRFSRHVVLLGELISYTGQPPLGAARP